MELEILNKDLFAKRTQNGMALRIKIGLDVINVVVASRKVSRLGIEELRTGFLVLQQEPLRPFYKRLYGLLSLASCMKVSDTLKGDLASVDPW